MRTRRLLICGGSLLLPFLLAAGSSTLAGEPAESADTLKLILEEVRQLRRTVELTALLQLKVQVAGERLRVREPQVRALAEQASQLEQQLSANAADLERTRAELARVEEKLGQETAPDLRRELAAQRGALVEAIGQMSAQDEENQRRVAAVRESLATERAELDRLLDVLADLERALERQVRGTAATEQAPPR
jgi:chromosome segregation ATPase